MVSETIEAPIQKAIEQTTEKLNNNAIISGLDSINNLNSNINIQGYYSPEEEAGMMDYNVAYAELKA